MAVNQDNVRVTVTLSREQVAQLEGWMDILGVKSLSKVIALQLADYERLLQEGEELAIIRTQMLRLLAEQEAYIEAVESERGEKRLGEVPRYTDWQEGYSDGCEAEAITTVAKLRLWVNMWDRACGIKHPEG